MNPQPFEKLLTLSAEILRQRYKIIVWRLHSISKSVWHSVCKGIWMFKESERAPLHQTFAELQREPSYWHWQKACDDQDPISLLSLVSRYKNKERQWNMRCIWKKIQPSAWWFLTHCFFYTGIFRLVVEVRIKSKLIIWAELQKSFSKILYFENFSTK